MIRIFCLSFLILFTQMSFAQNYVAFTIDDVPNTLAYRANGFTSPLLTVTDSLNIPVTIFINEHKLYETEFSKQNIALLEQWIKRSYVTPGNHTYSHQHYSTSGFTNFSRDVLKGETVTRLFSNTHHKTLRYFRFPYNDQGNNSAQYDSIIQFLNQHQYISVPFTIESSDWMYSTLYEHYLKVDKKSEAIRVANAYINHTLEQFSYFEKIAQRQYNRPIKHIYLCHDNALNATYLPVLVSKLKAKKYALISLDEALQDEVFKQKEVYAGRWGFSWVYRWIADSAERKKLMQAEPKMTEIEKEYEGLSGD